MATSHRQPRPCTRRNCSLAVHGAHYTHHANAKTAVLVHSLGSAQQTITLAPLASHALTGPGSTDAGSAAAEPDASRLDAVGNAATATAIDASSIPRRLPGSAVLVEQQGTGPDATAAGDGIGERNPFHGNPSATNQIDRAAANLSSAPFDSRSSPSRTPSESGQADDSIDPAILLLGAGGSTNGTPGASAVPARAGSVPGSLPDRAVRRGDEPYTADINANREPTPTQTQTDPARKRKKAQHGQGKKTLARLRANERAANRAATNPRSRDKQVKYHNDRTDSIAHNFGQTCLENGTFGVLFMAHPLHLGRKKSAGFCKLIMSDEFVSTDPTVPTDGIDLAPILSDSRARADLAPLISPDALVRAMESIFTAHVHLLQQRAAGVNVGKVHSSDELVRAANAKAEEADKARRKVEARLKRVEAELERRKRRRLRRGEESDEDDDEEGSDEFDFGDLLQDSDAGSAGEGLGEE